MKKHTEVIILGFLMTVCLITLVVVLATSCKNGFIPSSSSKGTLYLIPEALGFDVPELNLSQKIMDPSVAQQNLTR